LKNVKKEDDVLQAYFSEGRLVLATPALRSSGNLKAKYDSEVLC